jgi:beta-lactamase class A
VTHAAASAAAGSTTNASLADLVARFVSLGISYIRPMRPLVPVLLLLSAGYGAFPAATHPERAAPSVHREPQARRARLDTLRRRIADAVAAQPGAEVAVWYQDFATGDTLGVNADVSFHAASTMKVPVMIELFRRVDAGSASLTQTIPLANTFRSIVDGSPYRLTASEDSDTLLYRKVDSPVSLRELNERMITMSSNLATNVLIEQLDARTVTATAHALGATGMQVLRGVEDGKAFERGMNNTTTARALGVLLDAIEHGRAASRVACDSMRAVLLRQTETGEIPAGLPPGTRVAHKTGWITATLHDAAIVYPPKRDPYVLVVLTRKIPAEKDAQRLIAAVSRAVWESATASR